MFETEHIDENSQSDDFAHVKGKVVRLTFIGESTYDPILATVAREYAVDFSILAGRIERIKDTPCGQLTLALNGNDVEAALARFAAEGIDVEVLR